MIRPETYLPPPELRKYIVEYGVIHMDLKKMEPFFYPPTGLSGFLFQTNQVEGQFNVRIQNKDFLVQHPLAVGQVTLPVSGEIIGDVKFLLVFFHPLGMYELFGVNMAPLTNSAILLSNLIQDDPYNTLIDQLYSNQRTQHQIYALNTFFRTRIPEDYFPVKLERVLDFVHEQKGNVSIPDLEQIGFYHRKTLERHFRKMVGLAPKEYARIYQFKSLIQLIQSSNNMTWSQLAVEAGYYDLSHLSRYLHDYLQVSPNSIVKIDMELIYYLLDK